MSKRQRQYSAEFKQDAIRLALKRGNAGEVAEELGVPRPTLHSWVKRAKEDSEGLVIPDNGDGSPMNVKELLTELKDLRKRLQRVEEEKAILKKAAQYFAKESE